MSRRNALQKMQGAANLAQIKLPINHSVFDALPDSAFIRESQLVQSPKRPNTPAPLPFPIVMSFTVYSPAWINLVKRAPVLFIYKAMTATKAIPLIGLEEALSISPESVSHS